MAGIIKRAMRPQDDPEEAQEPAAEEQTETPDQETQESAQEPDEQGGEQPGEQEPEGGEAESGEGGQQDDEKSSGETQQDDDAVKQVVTAAMELLYRAKAINEIVQSIQKGGDVAKGLADGAYQIMEILDDKSNGKIPAEALAPAAIEILGLIAEDYEKITGQPVRGRDIAVATQQMVQRFLQEAGVQTGDAFEQVDYDKIGQVIDQYRGSKQ